MIGENEYADLVRGMTFEPSIPDLTHYMEAVSRLRKENADLRTQLKAAEEVIRLVRQAIGDYHNTYGKGE